MPLSGRPLHVARIVFAVAMAAAFGVAVSPLAIPLPEAEQGDKFQHILAFYGLTLFAAVAFPRAKLWVIWLLMAAYGALIEVVQGIPFVGRDRDIWDLAADCAASAGALIPFAFGRYRPSS